MTSKLRRLALRFVKDLVSRERYVIALVLLLWVSLSGTPKLIVAIAAALSLGVWTLLWALEKSFEEDSPR